MEFNIITEPLSKPSDCIVVAINQSLQLAGQALQLDQASDGFISDILHQGDFKAKLADTLLLFKVPGISSSRVLLVGTGDKPLTDAQFKKVVGALAKALSYSGAKTAVVCLEDFSCQNPALSAGVRRAVETMIHSDYVFDQFKLKKTPAKALTTVSLAINDASQIEAANTALSQAAAVGLGVKITRDLGNLPGNVVTPTYLAEQAQALAKQHPGALEVTVLGEKDMQELGMGALLAVANGSDQEAKLIVMKYQGASDQQQAPHVLVGKGITFDSGGISLKPGEAMDEMKYDMCGAGSVLGAMTALLEIKPKMNIVAVISSAENMPSGRATKPGDIVKTLSGQTVEILNTDAEGRLVLCDALTYVERFKPASVIDIATLTGACIIALGHHNTGLMTPHDDLAETIYQAARDASDSVWRLPVTDDYQPQLDSNFADIANIGGKAAGTVTAACFLSRFTKAYRWAHLDIAGTAWVSGKDKGATGRPVALLVQYMLNQQ